MKVLLLVAFCAGALAAPAKLGEHHDHHHHHEDPLALVAAEARDAQGYNYDPPAEPSGLYDLPEPTTTTTTTTTTTPPPTTTTTTTTTTPPPPPPPVDSYLPPVEGAADEPKPVTVLPPSPPKAETTMMPMPYEFKYDVADEVNGVQFAQDVDSDGIVTVGEYSVMLPDGRMQVVKYRVTAEDGYQAEVTYV